VDLPLALEQSCSPPQPRQLPLQPLALNLNIVSALRNPELLGIQRQDFARVFARVVAVFFVLVLRVQVVEAAREGLEGVLLGRQARVAVGVEGGEGG
jgi:hypothetical protein